MTRSSAAADRAAAAADRRRLLVVAVVAACAAVAVGVATWQGAHWCRDAHWRAQRDAVRTAAPTILADVFSHTEATAKADAARARANVTAEFAAANASALSGRAGAVTWKVRALGIGESRDNWVETVAVVSVSVPAAAAPADDRVVAARFISRDGRWLLDSVELIR